MSTMENKKNKDFFEGLPKEMVIMIMDHCNKEDKLYFSQTCKRIRNIYVNRNKKGFLFHLQGNRVKLLSAGLKFLLNTKFDNFDELKISHFPLHETLDKKFPDFESIFDKPYHYYLENSYAVNNVVTITIEECIISDYSLLLLRKLFPKLINLSIIRSYLSQSGTELLQVPKNEFLPLQKLALTCPFLTDSPIIFGWVLDSFVYPETALDYKKSFLSRKRAVARRFYKYKNKRINPSNFDEYRMVYNLMVQDLEQRGLSIEPIEDFEIDINNIPINFDVRQLARELGNPERWLI